MSKVTSVNSSLSADLYSQFKHQKKKLSLEVCSHIQAANAEIAAGVCCVAFHIRQAADEILICCCKRRRQAPNSTTPLIYCRQVSEAVEELCETTSPAGQQPEGQTDRQAEADTERGGSTEKKANLDVSHAFTSPGALFVFITVRCVFSLNTVKVHALRIEEIPLKHDIMLSC